MGGGASVPRSPNGDKITLVNYFKFKQLGRIPRNPEDNKCCILLNDIKDMQSSLVVFVSYKWNRANNPAQFGGPHPDNRAGDLYKLIVRGIGKLKSQYAPGISNCYLWFDFSCIDQSNPPIAANQLSHFREILSISDLIFTPIIGKAEEDFESILNKKAEVQASLMWADEENDDEKDSDSSSSSSSSDSEDEEKEAGEKKEAKADVTNDNFINEDDQDILDSDAYHLEINVFSATNLAIADKLTRSSDPYVVVKYGDKEVGRTIYISNTLNAYYVNEKFHLELPKTWQLDGMKLPTGEDAAPILHTLKFEVWDYDMVGMHDFLGGFEVARSDLKEWMSEAEKNTNICINKQFTLTALDSGKVDEGAIEVKGSIEVGIMADSSRNIMPKSQSDHHHHHHHHNSHDIDLSTALLEYEVHIFSARELPVADFFAGTSDPYAVIKFNRVEIGRTTTIKRNLNPDWDGQFFKISFGAETNTRNLSLIIEFWDWDLIGDHNFLGGVEFSGSGSEESSSLEEWFIEANEASGSCIRQSHRLTSISSLHISKQKLAGTGICEVGLKGLGSNNKIIRKLDALRGTNDQNEQSKDQSALMRENFQLIVHSARDLAMGDILTKSSDPFAVMTWNSREVGRTKPVPQCLSPQWNCHDFQAHYPSSKTAGSNKLIVEVYDHDFTGAHDFLGGFEISGNALQSWIDEAMSKPNVYVRKEFPVGVLKHIKKYSVSPQGTIDISIKYKKMHNSNTSVHNFEFYEIKVLQCQNLSYADKIRGSANPSVSISCNGIKAGSTPPELKTLNPKWKNETYGIRFPSTTKISKNKVVVEVWSLDFAFATENAVFLGGLELTSKELLSWVRASCEKPGMFAIKTFDLQDIVPIGVAATAPTFTPKAQGAIMLGLKSPDRRVLNNRYLTNRLEDDGKNKSKVKIRTRYTKKAGRRVNVRLDEFMRYDITLFSVVNLPVADTLVNSSDPYAVMKWDGKEIGRTPVTEKALTVYWKNMTHEISFLRSDEVGLKSLLVELWDHDSFGDHDFLGGIEIKADKMEHLLQESNKNPASVLRRKMKLGKITTLDNTSQELAGSSGIIEFGIKSHSTNFVNVGQLSVDTNRVSKKITYELEICSGEKFPNADFPFGLSDPYVIVKFNSTEFARTTVADNTLNPKWEDQMFLFSMPSSASFEEYSLVFEVWDHNLLTAESFLGGYFLSNLELQEWVAEAHEKQRVWIDKSIKLSKSKFIDSQLQKLVNKTSVLNLKLRMLYEELVFNDFSNDEDTIDWYSELKLDTWNSPTVGYLSRAWTRLEMIYAAYLPLKVDKERLSTFKGAIRHYYSRGMRPHFLYTTNELEKDRVPHCLTPFINSIGYYKKLDPRYGEMSLESDRSLISALYDDVRFLIKYTDIGYAGGYENGRRHKRGVFIFTNGDIYEGDFKNDNMEGCGILKYANGDYFIGEFVENKRCGKGIMMYRNGDVYHGRFMEDSLHGHGKMTYSNGDVYTGEFFENSRNGDGRMLFASGYIYLGTFVDDFMDGVGTMSYMKAVNENTSTQPTTPDLFPLIFYGVEADTTHTLYTAIDAAVSSLEVDKSQFKEILVYEGSFMNNQMHGNGRIHYFYGAIYSGDVSEGKANGAGEITYQNGDSYKGDFLNDRKHGQGVFILANGQKIGPGSWEMDKYRGSVLAGADQDDALVKKVRQRPKTSYDEPTNVGWGDTSLMM